MPDGGFMHTPGGAPGWVAAEALAGLGAARKSLPPKLFYDAAGCALFDEITRLPEYYVTRTEIALLGRIAEELGALLPAGAALVEFGASDETKARILLAHLRAPAAYVPIDIAAEGLAALRARMRDSHPGLPVLPVAADFLAPLAPPAGIAGMPPVGFFPGSTIGNLDPAEAARFLGRARALLGTATGGFVVGVDLRKPEPVLRAAYDDARGVTAAFNLNLLARLNREAAADFELARFAHEARWNDAESRIEMHLVSLVAQTVTVAGTPIDFAEGESIHTENSYKHSVGGFLALATRAGWQGARVWTDPAGYFAVHLLRAAG